VIVVLKTSCGEGRLTLDEFSERVETTFRAVTLPDVVPILADLPHPFGPDCAGVLSGESDHLPLPVTSPLSSSTTTGRKPTRWTVSIMGGSRRKGRWRLRERTTAVAIMGGCHLDLRNAEVEGSEVVIIAVAIMGGIEIVVPEGIEVELGGFAIMGGKDDGRVKSVRPLPGSPIIRVKALAIWGGVTIRSKPTGAGRNHDRALEMSPGPRLIDVVAEERDSAVNDLKASALPDGTVTIMFSDIEGFTSITEHLGDRKAMDVLREHNGIIRHRISISGGHEVKVQGDGFMVAFGGASSALQCAVGIQSDFAARNRSKPDLPVHVRLGLHAGEAIRDGNDFLGGAVILAARIAQQAKGDEILVSSVLKDLCDLGGEFQFHNGRDIYLKGLSESRRVYSVTGPEAGKA
jgi:class 3 adenylate cyclase